MGGEWAALMSTSWEAYLARLIPDGVRVEVVENVFTQELELVVHRGDVATRHALIGKAEQIAGGPEVMDLMRIRTRLALGLLPRFRRYRKSAEVLDTTGMVPGTVRRFREPLYRLIRKGDQ
jgi:hypothetical protein